MENFMRLVEKVYQALKFLIHLDCWSAGVALPSEVRYGTAITAGGKIYLIGGKMHLVKILIKFFFDPSTNQWTTKANMPTAGMELNLFGLKIEFGQ
jgi:N-acetylneuraminic acid mutarotase